MGKYKKQKIHSRRIYMRENVNKAQSPIQLKTMLRILTYTKPYKWRLTIGIIAGVLMAFSLFSSFLFMVSIFDEIMPAKTPGATIEERIASVQHDPNITEAQRIEAIIEITKPKEKEDSFDKKFKSFQSACEWIGFNSPATYNKKTQTVNLFDGFMVFQTEKEGRIAWQLFALSVSGLVIAFVFKNFFTYINKYFIRYVGARVVEQLRNDIFKKLMGQSLKYYGKNDIGVLMSRCTADVQAMETTVTLVAADMVRCPFEIIACMAGIIYASVATENYALPVILFFGVPLCIVPVIILGRRVRKIYKTTLSKIGEVTSRMHEVFTGIQTVKASAMEHEEQLRFEKINHGYSSTIIKALRYELAMSPLTEAVAVAATLIFLVYSYSHGISMASLAALMTPAFLAYQPFKTLSHLYSALQRSMAGAERYFQLLDTNESLLEPTNPKHIENFEKSIDFNHVEFSYNPGDRKTLKNLQFSIKKGDVVAVVGETGSGKSTIANLIARFYDVTGGSVTIDGINVKEISTDDLRRLIGIVSQIPVLFNESIADNIAYGMTEISREEIIKAAKKANANAFIVDGRHPEGYDTIVGEKGAILSGGEKQRIAIARAILKNPPILILDEATSALDTVTEKLVQEAINCAMENRTVFAIAHRLSTIKNANMILVLDKGEIVERGTHNDLYAQNGVYRRLCDIQFGEK